MDISSTVKATASSHVTSPRVDFSPQLAVQADTSHVWSSCFLSKKESNPWLKIEFKSVTHIFNVRLGVRKKGSGQIPVDFNLEGMDKLSVYVSNSSALGSIKGRQCGSPWIYRPTRNILLDCGKDVKGKFVYVTVPSASPTYMIICFIVFNRENGNVCSLIIADVLSVVVANTYTCLLSK